MKQKVTESDEIHSLTLGHETIDKITSLLTGMKYTRLYESPVRY